MTSDSINQADPEFIYKIDIYVIHSRKTAAKLPFPGFCLALVRSLFSSARHY